MTNGHLDTIIDWIPGMKGIRLRDLPSFIATTDLDDVLLNFAMVEAERAQRASAVILNTFDALEHEVLEGLSTMYPFICSIVPLQLLVNQIPDNNYKLIGLNLWKEEERCIGWLDKREPNSVVYVNFGSVTVMTSNQLIEFAWGLANSKQAFLWIIRSDLVRGDSAVLPPEFLEENKERGLLANWCSQEVLSHPSTGGFLTHSGWNSTLESVCGGVPMISWPFFAEQQTNCRYTCMEWGIGMEIESDAKRGKIESLLRELMVGEKGQKLKKKAIEWKKLAEEAISPNGSSFVNLDKIINQVLLASATN